MKTERRTHIVRAGNNLTRLMKAVEKCDTAAAIFVFAHRCLEQMFLTTTHITFLSPYTTPFLKLLSAGLSKTEIYTETCVTGQQWNRRGNKGVFTHYCFRYSVK
jgi:hypothetical protein